MQSSVLFIAVILLAPAPKEAPKKEKASIVGEWAVESMIWDGEKYEMPEAKIVIKADGTISYSKKAGDQNPATYKTDDKKAPTEFDWTSKDNGATMLGIYELEGDTLILCVADSKGAERPKRLESPVGSKTMLWTLKRIPTAKK